MVGCILAVLVIGAVAVGFLAYYGTSYFNWNFNPATTDFSFEAEVGATNETVALDVNVAAGSISIVFVDNESLLYEIDMLVQNTTLDTEGVPTVSFIGNTIGVEYPSLGMNITLGSGVNYTINILTQSGSVSVVFGAGAHIGDLTASVTSGSISIVMVDDTVLLGSPTFDLQTTTGGISIVADLPSGVGGSIECATSLGSVSITAAGWTEITSNHYETTDYDTASQTLTIVAQTGLGGVSAVLT
ncbi:MAG: hypothetical protein C4K48_01030 [Candidatus Thorarchaeota archaeon]|nr:MAG: hypothetical protein C4K48_01030 [Candidatus Thorarchaeota archaeon]